ncbi:hypothetical protein CU097_001596 [Rhizopus azygosporus]|uniref:Uncharacterized protein n=1 Tax=Rhizopus azygosporus TaxID=86630 RepID=A0A367IPX3_RHIAZ|nr:hypothetical protein CU097_001596 [Rhizopus azygosporus]
MDSAHSIKGNISVNSWIDKGGRSHAAINVYIKEVTTNGITVKPADCDKKSRKVFIYSHCIRNWGDNVVAEGCSIEKIVELLNHYVRIEDATKEAVSLVIPSTVSKRGLKRQQRMGSAYFGESLQGLQTKSTAGASDPTPATPTAPASTDIDNNKDNIIHFGKIQVVFNELADPFGTKTMICLHNQALRHWFCLVRCFFDLSNGKLFGP